MNSLMRTITRRQLEDGAASLEAALETVQTTIRAVDGADETNPVTNDEFQAAKRVRWAAVEADHAAADSLVASLHENDE